MYGFLGIHQNSLHGGMLVIVLLLGQGLDLLDEVPLLRVSGVLELNKELSTHLPLVQLCLLGICFYLHRRRHRRDLDVVHGSLF